MGEAALQLDEDSPKIYKELPDFTYQLGLLWRELQFKRQKISRYIEGAEFKLDLSTQLQTRWVCSKPHPI